MRNSALALSCILLAGVAVGQQTTATSSAKPAAAAVPASTSASKAAPAGTDDAAPPPPAHPLTDAQAHQMLELTGGTKIKNQLTSGYMNYIRSSMPFMPKDVNDDLQQSFDKLDLDTPIIAVYKQRISTEDADAIISFYKTPAGKSMIDAMPQILQQQQQIAVQEGRKTAQEVIQKHRPEIEAAAKQYQQEHAPASPAAPSGSQVGPGTATPGATTQKPDGQGTAKPTGSGSNGAGSNSNPSPSSNPQPQK